MTEKVHNLRIVSLPSFEDLFLELSQPRFEHAHEEFPSIPGSSGNSVVAVLHSSGSTGLPRPVVYTQEGMLYNFVNQRKKIGLTLPQFTHWYCSSMLANGAAWHPRWIDGASNLSCHGE